MSPADEASPEQALDRLLERYPLGGAWTEPTHFAETVVIGEVRIDLCGLSARCAEQIATGSAAGVGERPLARAYFELIERTSILEAIFDPARPLALRGRDERWIDALPSALIFPAPPDARCVYARSNGVAVGPDWCSACDAARWELSERDRILRSWYGAITPLRAKLEEAELLPGLCPDYELEAYTFPALDRENAPYVAGVFAFPRRVTHPIVYGFAAHGDEQRSIDKAARECLQRLGFLWGEALPSCDPEFAPNAEYHQEFYLQPRMERRLRAWLAGDHVSLRCGIRQHDQVYRERAFVDLTPRNLKNRLCVVKALPIFEIELVFGHGHPRVEPPLPAELLVHPVA